MTSEECQRPGLRDVNRYNPKLEQRPESFPAMENDLTERRQVLNAY